MKLQEESSQMATNGKHAYAAPGLRRLGALADLTAAGSLQAPSENNSALGCVVRTEKANPACKK